MPGSFDTEQFAEVQKFKERARSSVSTANTRVSTNSSSTPVDTSWRPSMISSTCHRSPNRWHPKRGARPVARVERRERQRVDSKGLVKIERDAYLIIENKGSGDAKNVALNWVIEDIEEGLHPPMAHDMEDPIASLVEGGHVSSHCCCIRALPIAPTSASSWRTAPGSTSTYRRLFSDHHGPGVTPSLRAHDVLVLTCPAIVIPASLTTITLASTNGLFAGRGSIC